MENFKKQFFTREEVLMRKPIVSVPCAIVAENHTQQWIKIVKIVERSSRCKYDEAKIDKSRKETTSIKALRRSSTRNKEGEKEGEVYAKDE